MLWKQEETDTGRSCCLTVNAAQTLDCLIKLVCQISSNYLVKSCLQSNMAAAYNQSPAAAARTETTCEPWWGQTDQNKWCFCAGLVAGGCRGTLSRSWEGGAAVVAEAKSTWIHEAPVEPDIRPQNFTSYKPNVSYVRYRDASFNSVALEQRWKNHSDHSEKQQY